jgi:Helix-turn-helix domain
VQDNTEHGQRAQTQPRVARGPIPLTERLGYSPAEFAALFGRSPTWGYRQIYAGRIKPVADCGRLIIPRAEVESVLARRREYNPTKGANR